MVPGLWVSGTLVTIPVRTAVGARAFGGSIVHSARRHPGGVGIVEGSGGRPEGGWSRTQRSSAGMAGVGL